MLRYVWKRLLLLIPVVIGVSFFIFVAVNAANGDFVDTLNTEDMSAEEIAALRAKYGLDQPLLVRYGLYMWNLLHGDLGTSYTTGLPVFELFMSKIGNTLYARRKETIERVFVDAKEKHGMRYTHHRGLVRGYKLGEA